ncbi:MAG: tetratricopeptide repeat protein [Phycisphaerales bacterium JB064]
MGSWVLKIAVAALCLSLGVLGCDRASVSTSTQSQTSELEETAQRLNDMYGFNIDVGAPEGVGASLVRCDTSKGTGERVDGSFGLVVREEVVLVPLARLLRGERVTVKAACCEERPATGVYAFDARSGLALLAVPGLQAPSWNGGFAELPEPAPGAITARVGFPFEIAGSMGVGTSTLDVTRESDDPLRGRRLRLDHSFRLFGGGAILIDEAGTPMGITTEWAGNDKSWAVPIADFLDEHLHANLDDSKIITITKLIESAPDDRAKSIMLTMRAGSDVDHRALLDIAIELEPQNALAHYHRGVVLDMLGQKEDSLKALFRSLDIDDTWSEPWYSLGLVQLTSGKPSVAVDPFRRAVRIDPTHADAHGMIGVAYLHADRADLAIEPMHKAVELEPDRYQFAANLALAYEHAGQEHESYKAWEAYAKAKPEDQSGHTNYCIALAIGNQLDRLRTEAVAGLSRFGDNADDLAFQAYAIGMSEHPDVAKAHELARQALKLEPDHPVAGMVLERIH